MVQYKHYFILTGDYGQSNQLIVYDAKNQQARYFRTNLQGKRLGASILGDQLHVYGGVNTNLGLLKEEHYKISLKKIIQGTGKIQ